MVERFPPTPGLKAAARKTIAGIEASQRSQPEPDWTAAELQRVRDRANLMETLLAQAVEDWPEFDCDDEVNGGDLVEWFGQWRAKAKALLDV